MFISIIILLLPAICSSNINETDQNSISTQFPDKQRVEKEMKTVDSGYTCTGDSFFSAITRNYTAKATEACNIFERSHSSGKDHFFGLRVNKKSIEFSAEGDQLLVDTNGAENIVSGLFIGDGKCKGDLLFYDTVYKVVRGSCTGDTGVTEIDSYPAGEAVLAIVGTCNSTCTGRAIKKYNPGKKPRTLS